MVKAMDAVGVDGALLVSPFSLYRYDASYALEVHASHSSRFGLIKPFNPNSESVTDEMDAWAKTPGVVGARLMLNSTPFDADHPGLNRILAAGAQVGIPINVMCSGKLSVFRDLAIRNPNTQLIVDHIGLAQPHIPPVPSEPFSDLANVISLAEYDNVAIKISGACTLSLCPFPYPDIWEHLQKIFYAFGFDRCMWGTDWTRAMELLGYHQGVESFRVTECLSANSTAQAQAGLNF